MGRSVGKRPLCGFQKGGKTMSKPKKGAAVPAKRRHVDKRTLFVRIVAGAIALLMLGSIALSALFL